jgi:hypothetical protein
MNLIPPDDLERHGPVQLAVLCAIDGTHPALAEHLDDLVALGQHQAGG